MASQKLGKFSENEVQTDSVLVTSRTPSTENICRYQASTFPLSSLHCVTDANTLNQNLRFETAGFVYTSEDWDESELKAWLLTSASIQCSSQSSRDLRLSFECGSDWTLESNPVCQELMSRSMQLPYKAYVTSFLQTDLFLVYLFFCERKAISL